MEKIIYDKAKISDVLRISVLLKTVYIQTYAIEGVTLEFANFITNRFSPEYITEMIVANPSRFTVAYHKQNPIGVAELIPNSTCPIRNIHIPELSKLYVLERFYGKGVGIGLLNRIESELTEKGQNELYLEVWSQNLRAKAFYDKHGFIVLGKSKFQMEFNCYDNFVMYKKLI